MEYPEWLDLSPDDKAKIKAMQARDKTKIAEIKKADTAAKQAAAAFLSGLGATETVLVGLGLQGQSEAAVATVAGTLSALKAASPAPRLGRKRGVKR